MVIRTHIGDNSVNFRKKLQKGTTGEVVYCPRYIKLPPPRSAELDSANMPYRLLVVGYSGQEMLLHKWMFPGFNKSQLPFFDQSTKDRTLNDVRSFRTSKSDRKSNNIIEGNLFLWWPLKLKRGPGYKGPEHREDRGYELSNSAAL